MSGVLPSLLLVFGLALVFMGERIAGEGTIRDVLFYGGLALVAAAAFGRAFLRARARGAAKTVETRLLYAKLGVIFGLALYALSTEWGLDLLGMEEEAAERTGGVLEALYPAALLVSLAGLFFMELVYRRMPVSEAVELRRVQGSAHAGIGLALSLVFLFSINYVAQERDEKADLSYFKTTHPSEGTLRMVGQLEAPVKVILFYPEVNDVLEELRPYFNEVDAASDKITVQQRDHALAPGIAQQHRVRGNGFVVLLKGEGEAQTAEQFEVGTDLEIARSRLRTLDGRFQQSFAKLTRQRREVHMTTGHAERSASGAQGDQPEQRIDELTTAFRRANIEMRQLGIAQGLGNRVPEGAPAVLVVGPRERFLTEEANVLVDYLQHGGRVAVMVDPTVDHGLDPLLHRLGIAIQPGFAASSRNHLVRTRTPADNGVIVTNDYSSHPTVTLASRNQGQVATVFVEAGTLDRHEGADVIEGSRVVFPIRTGTDFWRDLDGDWEQDDGEPTGRMNLMAAVTVPSAEAGGEEGRAVIIADGDFVSDAVFVNPRRIGGVIIPGNALIFGDIIQWFLGEEQIIGDTSSEEDVQIEHTRDADKLWFWATSFGAPLPLLGLGLWIAVRRKRRRETHEGKKKAAAPPPRAAPPKGEDAADDEEDADDEDADDEEQEDEPADPADEDADAGDETDDGGEEADDEEEDEESDDEPEEKP